MVWRAVTRPPPVLQLLGPSTGGIRRHVAHLTDRLAERGWPVAVAGPAAVLDGLRPLDHVVEVPGVEASGAVLLPAVRSARCALAALVGDVGLIHAHGLKAGWVAASLRRRPPLVVTVHNLVLPEAAGAVTPVLRALEARLPERAGHTIVVSAEMARRFTGVRGAGRVRVIAPASPAQVPTRPVAQTRARFGVEPGQALAVCVARLHPQKGLDVLLGASAVLRGRLPGLRVVIVGEGPLEAELRRQASALGLDGTVIFAGPSPHAVDELAAADVVVVPSRWEGWPLVVSEALHLGRPLVATAVGGVPDMVLDQVSGVLVAPGDVLALAEAIGAVLGDPAAAGVMARAGTRLVAERYPPDALVDQVEAVYADALAAR